MYKGELKINRIKSANKEYFKILSEVVEPNRLHDRVPRLGEVAEARRLHKSRIDQIRELSKHQGSRMDYVAQIDQSIWSAILSVFARYDPETNEFIDDGLLYKYNPERGCVVLNKDFFFALVEILESAGYNCDMRGKVQKIIV